MVHHHRSLLLHPRMADTVQCIDVFGKLHQTLRTELQWRPAAYGIVIKDRQVLLLRQFGGEYDLPGGGVNIGEDPKTAAIREIKEESGIEAENPVLLGVESSLFRASHSDNKSYHSLLLYYSCSYVSGHISVSSLDETESRYIDTAEWVDLKLIDSIKISSTVDSRPYIKQASC
ncbi:ADP-ribose pyrophosphatase [Pseudocercospora fuligena]|uniref:ADP-ribose pyrophosphatase n=1 Tax=Pseudocercospora fuligena TaxID=685502 RepID=A0A8H6RHF4_9PEZI|nr:ADP-ribose pyrophosphatase [Pseudocercospora fuligena]